MIDRPALYLHHWQVNKKFFGNRTDLNTVVTGFILLTPLPEVLNLLPLQRDCTKPAYEIYLSTVNKLPQAGATLTPYIQAGAVP